MKNCVLTLPNLLFITLLICIFTPYSLLDPVVRVSNPTVFVVTVVLIWLYYQYQLNGPDRRKVANDIGTFVFLLLLVWELVTTKFHIAPYVFVPAPENVFYVFLKEWDLILTGFFRSMFLLLAGFCSAIAVGVSLGLVVGWVPRLRRAVFPISKAISTVPAMIYTPYMVMLLPDFVTASIFVIFLGIFWPTFMNQINRVGTIDHKIIDTAKVLNVPLRTMLFKVILPYTMPRIINSLTVMLSVSIMTLTAAEMMGADRGMGYFVRYFSAQINYTNTIAGILFIALVVTMLNFFVGLLKKKLVKWNY
jgi:NitT/TauT family transport system permease protein